jgi:hypothetical protein
VSHQTQAQRRVEAFARALHRAHARGLLVTGKGSRKRDGAPVYTVTSSSQPGRWHLVAVVGARLQCDCQAGRRGLVCQHRAVVHERIASERTAERMAERMAECEGPEGGDAA